MASCLRAFATRRHGKAPEVFMAPKSEVTMPKARPASTGPALQAATPSEGRSRVVVATSKMASRGDLQGQALPASGEDGPRSAKAGS